MIRLTHTSGKSVYIMPENVVDFFQSDTGDTLITFVAGHGYRVKESPEEVARKVLDYKISMTQYQTYLAIDTTTKDWTDTRNVARYIKSLAGLEEQKDATQTSD